MFKHSSFCSLDLAAAYLGALGTIFALYPASGAEIDEVS